ncbi:MAG: histidine triad family protein [Candidatus Poribacteria bacterium]|nr:histidine triad family protein [Candidatus Poribacteria bacterium]
MSNCIFCEIIAGKALASIVYQDDLVIAVMDIHPVNPGHLMVIPKKHVAYMDEMDENTGMHLFRIAMRLQQSIRKSGVRCEGINLFLADGEAASQEIFHLHLHVFPRFNGDSFKIDADWSVNPSRQELDEVAKKINKAYTSLW